MPSSKQSERSLEQVKVMQSDSEQDVIPIYGAKNPQTPPSLPKICYDIVVVVAILLDLAVVFFDHIVMSALFEQFLQIVGGQAWLLAYKTHWHTHIEMAAELFTVFLVIELGVRWLIAIQKRTYARWFFFPFMHWYEVLGCFPLLRPLRLLRGFIIIKRLHQMNIKIVPNRWIKTFRFYGHILLEELSDRVILTAIDNVRMQMHQKTTKAKTNVRLGETIDKNRDKIEQALLVVLRQELLPKLHLLLHTHLQKQLAMEVGEAVVQTLGQMPQFRRYLKLIPIAGSMIESQVVDIGRQIGQNVTVSVSELLLADEVLDELMVHIAKGVANIDTKHPEVLNLIQMALEEGLYAFEQQVKIQQYQHSEQLPL